jgi:hypothetical protein
MDTGKTNRPIHRDRRRLLGLIAGIVAASAASMLPARLAVAGAGDAAQPAAVTSAFARSARELSGPSPYNAVENEPAPRLIVDPPLPHLLAHGVVQIQYRVENVRILSVFGAGALDVSPRVGHLHVHVDDLPWWWAETADNNNTIDFAGVPPGEHKVRIELVDANHRLFPGQAVTVSFTVPERASSSHHH